MDRSILDNETRPQQPRGRSELRALSCGPLRLVFQRIADRWQHRLEWSEASAARPAPRVTAPSDEPHGRLVLSSLEGGPLDDWPPSPPLQELHLEERGSIQPVALLVGMAGASHWSLGVECAPQGDALLLDVACRAARPPAWLGSRYQLGPRMASRRRGADSWIVASDDDRACRLELSVSLAVDDVSLAFDGAPPTPAASSYGGAAQRAADADLPTAAEHASRAGLSCDRLPAGIQIAAPALAAADDATWPRTIRWRYAIRAIRG